MSIANLNNAYNGQIEKENFLALVRHYESSFIKACRDQGVDVTALGEDGSPSTEAIRFKSINSLAFSLDDINRLKNENHPDQYEYFVSFMGILGAAGVLPQHYTKLCLERVKKGDLALSDFVGLFEHRLISLYYKSLNKYKLALQYKENKSEPVDNISSVLKSISGYFNHNVAQLFYSGYFSKKNRSAENLKMMIADVVSKKITVHSFEGQWLSILDRDRCKIGRLGANNNLQSGIVLGKRYWDIQSLIRIVIYDLSMNEYQQLSQDSAQYKILASLVSAYVPSHINVIFEFRVNDKKGQVAPLGQGLQLSANAWLGGKNKDNLVAKRNLIKNKIYK